MLVKAWISAVLVSTGMGAQSPAFEVAAVKPATGSGSIGWFSYPGGRLEITNCTLSQIIQLAYSVEAFQLSGGPGWVSRDVWNIIAKAPAASEAARYVPKSRKYPPAPEALLMLRMLLADRFQLTLQHETREGPGYALVVGSKGPKFGETKDHDAFPVVAFGVSEDKGLPWWFRGENASMEKFATFLAERLRAPVLDRTGLKGEFDFTVKYADPDGVVAAVQEQLGLRLVATKLPLEHLVIARVEKPVEN